MKLNPESAVPLYKQMEDTLQHDIENGRFDENQRLPSELELSEEYNVSVITSRRALSELVKKGILERKQGKGTFIARKKFKKNFQTVISFSDACRKSGMIPGSRVLESDIRVADPELKERLELPAEENQVVYISRIRYADNEPICIETNQFSKKFSFLLNEDMNHQELIKTLVEKAGINVAQARRELTIIRASAQEAKQLNVSRSYPLLKIQSIAYDETGSVLFCGTQLINCDRFQLTI